MSSEIEMLIFVRLLEQKADNADDIDMISWFRADAVRPWEKRALGAFTWRNDYDVIIYQISPKLEVWPWHTSSVPGTSVLVRTPTVISPVPSIVRSTRRSTNYELAEDEQPENKLIKKHSKTYLTRTECTAESHSSPSFSHKAMPSHPLFHRKPGHPTQNSPWAWRNHHRPRPLIWTSTWWARSVPSRKLWLPACKATCLRPRRSVRVWSTVLWRVASEWGLLCVLLRVRCLVELKPLPWYVLVSTDAN